MNSSVSSYTDDIFNNILGYLNRYVIVPFYILGNIGCLLNALVFSRKSWKKNVCVFYFLVYLLLDFIAINTFILGSIFTNGFGINLSNSSVILCKLLNYLKFLFSTLSPTVLVLASIDRLLISSQNVDTRLYSSKRLAYFTTSINTLFWFVFYFHVLIEFDLQEFGPTVFRCSYDPTSPYGSCLSYSLLIINVILFLLMIILSVLSFRNVRQIRAAPRGKRNIIRSMHKKDFQILCCLFVKNIIYIICSSVLAIYTIYTVTTKYQIRTRWDQSVISFVLNLGTMIYQMSYCVSCFVYITMSKAFCQELKRLLYKIWNGNPPAIRQDAREVNIELNIISPIALTS